MTKELIFKNKQCAELVCAHLSTDKAKATLVEKDKTFVVSYIKADDSSVCVDEKLAALAEYFYSMVDSRMRYVYESMDNIYNMFYEHKQGHLPALNPSGLQKLIKVSGQEEDFRVEKRVIYASTAHSLDFGPTELKAAIDKIQSDEGKPSPDADVSRLMNAIRAEKK